MKRVILVCFIFLVSISIVNALGVASPYWKDHPLKISPGESEIFNLNLQNVVDEEDIIMKVSLVADGNGIAKLVEGEKEYLVKAGTYDTYIPVEIKIPKNFGYGTVEVQIDLTPLIKQEGGNMVDLSTKITQKIPVEITGEDKSKITPQTQGTIVKIVIFIIISFVVLLILIFLIVRFLAKKKSEKMAIENSYQKEATNNPY